MNKKILGPIDCLLSREPCLSFIEDEEAMVSTALDFHRRDLGRVNPYALYERIFKPQFLELKWENICDILSDILYESVICGIDRFPNINFELEINKFSMKQFQDIFDNIWEKHNVFYLADYKVFFSGDNLPKLAPLFSGLAVDIFQEVYMRHYVGNDYGQTCSLELNKNLTIISEGFIDDCLTQYYDFYDIYLRFLGIRNKVRNVCLQCIGQSPNTLVEILIKNS